MGTYYVRKSGNDTTGNGSDANPWLTVAKAQESVPWAGDQTVLVGPGIYSENLGGLQYLNLQRSQSGGGYLTVQSENGNAEGVTIQGSSSTTYQVRLDNADHIKLRNLSFSSGVALSDLYSVVRLTGNVNHVEFWNCKVVIPSVAGRTLFGLFGEATGAGNFNNILVDGCKFEQSGVEAVGLLRIGRQAGASVVDTISIRNSSFPALLYALYLYGITNLLIDGINASNTSQPSPNVCLGQNADAGLGCSGVIKNSVFASTAGHALLIGAICANIELDNLVVNGGDQGLVLKHSDTISVSNSRITNGTLNAFYCKGATNVMARFNRILNNAGTCVRVGASGDATKSGNIDFQHNRVRATGAAKLFAWADDTGDAGGGVCNYNTYKTGPVSAPFGSVRGDAHVNTLAELRAAWAGYGDGSNDGHSKKAAKPLYLR